MQTTTPGSTTVFTESGLPTAQTVGFQVIRAATGTVAVGRSTVGVAERPLGSGNYVFTFVAPVEGDLYLVVSDWSGGVLAPETSRVTDLKVTAEVELGSSGLGVIADYAKMHLGGQTWKGLTTSIDYGEAYVARAVEVIKARALTSPPATGDENTLHPLALDYLGVCVALELIPAAIDYWGSQHIAISMGNEPSENVTYANRANLMKELRDELVRLLAQIKPLATPYLENPVVTTQASMGPSIDEDDDCKVTADPRDFPSHEDFPGGMLSTDYLGFPTRPLRSGVRR